MPASWIEVQQAQEENRRELVLSGSSFSERIEKNGLDPAIFKNINLNFLEISKVHLKELPPDIGKLSNLTRLVLSHNELTQLPSQIEGLSKLLYLDLSYNALTELPPEVSNLTQIQSFNVSFNQLSDLPPLNDMTRLVNVNICRNKFTTIPATLCDAALIHFTDLIANNNCITEIPVEVEHMSVLKVLDLGENELVDLPGELGNCTKLKELNLKGNKLKDKRLAKLVNQCHVKQIMDYVRSHCAKSNAENNKQGKSKKKVKQAKKNDVEEVTESMDELKILHVADDTLKVVFMPVVTDVRACILCCNVFDVNLSDPAVLKKFISLQTKLHESICEKRTVATIATHDLSKIQGDLVYDARPPKEIKIIPLNKKTEVTAAKLYIQLNEEADAIRKEKKKNTYSGIHKYLYLLKDKPLYPCLVDSAGTVISFPPITNSEVTKISTDTKNMLLEVTGKKMSECKKVMDALLAEMLKLGVGIDPAEAAPEEGGDEEVEFRKNCLTVQQVKIVDEEGRLKVVYPSRTDVDIEGITVTRA